MTMKNPWSGRFAVSRRGRMGVPSLVVAGLSAALLAWPSPAALAADFVLIHNVKTGTASVTTAQLKDMAIGKKKAWDSGAPVQLVLTAAGTPEMQWFARLSAKIADATLLAKIKQEVFKGELRRPVMVSSDKECVAAVAADPGGVGVVSAETAKSLPAGVTALAVQ